MELREVKDLPFTDPALGALRVVLAEEHWGQVQRLAGRKVRVPQQSHWRWLATRELDGYGMPVIWRIGHQRGTLRCGIPAGERGRLDASELPAVEKRFRRSTKSYFSRTNSDTGRRGVRRGSSAA